MKTLNNDYNRIEPEQFSKGDTILSYDEVVRNWYNSYLNEPDLEFEGQTYSDELDDDFEKHIQTSSEEYLKNYGGEE